MNSFDTQANDFITKHGISIHLEKNGQRKQCTWEPSGHGYRVTVKRKGKQMSFDFFDSVSNMVKGLTPSHYSILACLSSEMHCSETLKDFCAEFGYEVGKASEKTFKSLLSMSRKIHEFFTKEQLKELSEIW